MQVLSLRGETAGSHLPLHAACREQVPEWRGPPEADAKTGLDVQEIIESLPGWEDGGGLEKAGAVVQV